MSAAVDVQRPLVEPVLPEIAVDNLSGDVVFVPEVAARVLALEKVARMPYLAHDAQGQWLLRVIHAGDQPLSHTHNFGVDHKLLKAEAALKVHHAGARHHVDASQGAENRARGSLKA